MSPLFQSAAAQKTTLFFPGFYTWAVGNFRGGERRLRNHCSCCLRPQRICAAMPLDSCGRTSALAAFNPHLQVVDAVKHFRTEQIITCATWLFLLPPPPPQPVVSGVCWRWFSVAFNPLQTTPGKWELKHFMWMTGWYGATCPGYPRIIFMLRWLSREICKMSQFKSYNTPCKIMRAHVFLHFWCWDILPMIYVYFVPLRW